MITCPTFFAFPLLAMESMLNVPFDVSKVQILSRSNPFEVGMDSRITHRMAPAISLLSAWSGSTQRRLL